MSPIKEYEVSYDEIVASLVVLLTDLIRYREEHRPAAKAEFKVYSVDDLEKIPPEIVSHPVEAAYSLAFVKLGRMLHALGGSDLMEKAAWDVEERMGQTWGLVKLDREWDGIGDWIS